MPCKNLHLVQLMVDEIVVRGERVVEPNPLV